MARLHIHLTADFSTLTSEQAFRFLSEYFRVLVLESADDIRAAEVHGVPGDPEAHLSLLVHAR